MAAGAGAGGGGADEVLVLVLRPRRRRLPLSDLTNLSSATTRLNKARTERKRSSGSSTSSIGSSTNPRIPTPRPPPPPSAHGHVAGIKGKDKVTRELHTSAAHLKKIQNLSKPKVKTGGVLPGPSSPPIINKRKITRKEQPLYASSKTKVKTGGDVLSVASNPPSKKTMKVTSGREEDEQAEIMDDDMSCDEEGPSEDFIQERRAYFAEIDAYELVEEFVSSGSDAE